MQTKKQSIIEVTFNVFLGAALAFGLNCLILPLFGMPINLSSYGLITVAHVILGITRSYIVRRYFNKKDS